MSAPDPTEVRRVAAIWRTGWTLWHEPTNTGTPRIADPVAADWLDLLADLLDAIPVRRGDNDGDDVLERINGVLTRDGES